jgi:hypothetical protein
MVALLRRAGILGWLSVLVMAMQNVGFSAVTRYVNQATGSDANDGLAATRPFKTIQQACRLVQPGDVVIVAPGVYFESPEITRTGAAAAPITFQADQVARGRVVITGAVRGIRTNQAAWTLENAALGLYSTPLGYLPATVLYDDVDLFGYQSLSELQSFRVADLSGRGQPAPGPRHGFTWSGGKLYVRLYAGGRYGSTNPAAHVMKVAPPRASGYRGDVITQASDYNFAIKTTVPAYVVLDGFTFESPGFTGVWIQYGNVTVRNCWFTGCRTGVRGWLDSENIPAQKTADVIVENCDYSEYPTFEDAVDVVQAAEAMSAVERAALPTFFWWHRKGGAFTHEIGLVTSAGLRWKIRGNYVHETIDGLSFLGIGNSDQTEVSGNRFERLLDNAIECENHASNLRVHHNYVIDAFEPFSYQPTSTAPFPASVRFFRNVVFTRPDVRSFWSKPILAWTPGCIKIKTPSSFSSAGLDGFAAYNNTIFSPGAEAFVLNTSGSLAGNFKFVNNICVTAGLQNTVPATTLPNMQFRNNFVAPGVAGQPGPTAVFAGQNGRTFATYAQIGMVDADNGNFSLRTDSPAIGGGVALSELPDSSADVGALRGGETWAPPRVGPNGGGTTVPPVTPPPVTPPPDSSGTTTTIVDDGFSDGLRTDGSDAKDVNWWIIEASSGGTTPLLSIVDDTAGIGSGKALHVENAGANSQLSSTKAIVAPFSQCNLEAVGDRLVLRFDFRFVQIFAGDPLNAFRFGLYNSNGSPVTGDRQAASYNDSGYTATVTYGGTGGNAFFTKEGGSPTTTLFEEDIVQMGSPIATGFSVGVTPVKRTAIFTLTRTAAGVALTAQILNESGAILLSGTREDTITPVTSVNQIVVGTERMEADYRIDNVKVDLTRAP